MARSRAALLCFMLSGCISGGSMRDSGHLIRGHTEYQTVSNDEKLECLYGDEWKVYSSDNSNPPAHGLALSGGGMRSASFSVGVLQALSERGYLRQVDVLSAVSGGGYAAAWYIAHASGAGTGHAVNDEDLFRDTCRSLPNGDRHDCRYQEWLASHGKILTVPVFGSLVLDIVGLPLNGLANALMGWHANTTPHREAYELSLADAFLKEPPDPYRPPVLLNVTFAQLRPTKQKKIPFLIMNTTAVVDDDSHHAGSSLENTAFEFTPLWYGSNGFGYRRDDYPFGLVRGVAVSGAGVALGERAGNVPRFWSSVFNADVGYYIDNLNMQSDAHSESACRTLEPSKKSFWKVKLIHRLLPFPAYLFHHHIRDANGYRIYLTDGGGSDNLGAFALIRRLTRNILIVDATMDTQYEFDDYYKLKQSVLRELGVTLNIDEIQQLRGYDALTRRRMVGERPVMTGTVCCFPDSKYGDESLHVTYIKPAVTSTQTYPANVEEWYRDTSGKFPQENSADQRYDAQQYRAYRDLGHHLAWNGVNW